MRTERHNARNCLDPSCGHSAHGLSTAGENFETRIRAGQVYDGDGAPTTRLLRRVNPNSGATSEVIELVSSPYDPLIAAGGDVAIDEIDHDPESCPVRRPALCPRCDKVDAGVLQPKLAIANGRGSHAAKAKAKRRVIATAEPAYILASYAKPGKKPEFTEEPFTFTSYASDLEFLDRSGGAPFVRAFWELYAPVYETAYGFGQPLEEMAVLRSFGRAKPRRGPGASGLGGPTAQARWFLPVALDDRLRRLHAIAKEHGCMFGRFVNLLLTDFVDQRDALQDSTDGFLRASDTAELISLCQYLTSKASVRYTLSSRSAVTNRC